MGFRFRALNTRTVVSCSTRHMTHIESRHTVTSTLKNEYSGSELSDVFLKVEGFSRQWWGRAELVS